jgi:hypothetical protein
MIKHRIAAPSVRRLPSCLHITRRLQREGGEYIPETLIALGLRRFKRKTFLPVP